VPKSAEVLIVGDETPQRAALAGMLDALGYAATIAAGCDEISSSAKDALPRIALVCAIGTTPDLVAIVEALRRVGPEMAVLAVVDHDDVDATTRAIEAGADDVILVPFRDVVLRARIEARQRLLAAHEELKRKDDDNQLMLELTQALASSLDFEDILYTVVHRIAEVVKVDRCSIVLTGVSPVKGYVVASSEDPNIRDLPIDLPKYPEVQKVLKEARRLVIDVGTDPLLDEVRSSIPSHGPVTSALFPIMHESRVMGVLFLRFRAQRQDLTERELALCQTVANATAISLRNARFVRALRDEQARISLAHSEAERKVEALSHYADFFESSADGMLVVDAEGTVLYANPRMASLTGLSVQELTTRKLKDLVADEEQSILERLLAGFARGAYPRGLDLKFKGAFDERVILSVSASSTLRLAQGVLLILRDVTAARATEAELRRTKEFLEALIAQSVDAIIASDMDGRILLFNPAAERVLGYRAADILGEQMIENMYPPGVARRIMNMVRSKAHGGPGRLEQTRATILAKDGTEVPISMTGGMIYEYGEPRATFGIFTDLRERLEIENDLARMRLELMEREREAIAAQLAGAAAHELNQPLTSVMASVELLRRKLGADTTHAEIVETIVAETERMARIVRKIGRITHYETTTYVGSTRIIDINRSSAEAAPREATRPERTFTFDEEAGSGDETNAGAPVERPSDVGQEGSAVNQPFTEGKSDEEITNVDRKKPAEGAEGKKPETEADRAGAEAESSSASGAPEEAEPRRAEIEEEK
jgi:PAS domain S-box-containing protein